MKKGVNLKKKGLAFSMAAMIGATGIPTVGFLPVQNVYAADEAQAMAKSRCL